MLALDDLDPRAIEERTPHDWRVFFDSAARRDEAIGVLSQLFDETEMSLVSVDVPDEDWAERSQADLHAISIGRFIIAPPWDVPATSARESASVLIIRPSMGFGTGHHASTRVCLLALQEISVTARTVLDLGTGSGVLALAAARLGASRVVAIDRDPDAVESARESFALNELSLAIDLRAEDLRTLAGIDAALVIGNLTGGFLMRHAADVMRHVRPEGHAIVGGFTTEEEPDVVRAFERHARLVRRGVEDDWVALTFRPLSGGAGL